MLNKRLKSIACRIAVVGGGLAGSECALKLAQLGASVRLIEMRPKVKTEAHKTGDFAELVCSNSLKSVERHAPHGILKQEMTILGSNILQVAQECAIPGGKALVVNRDLFSRMITERIRSSPKIEVVVDEVVSLSDLAEFDKVCIATGPLTSDRLSREISGLIGSEFLSFYDAASPIISGSEIDYSKGFWGSRNSEDQSYFNIPLSKERYYEIINLLCNGDVYEPHIESEKKIRTFNGCRPIEDIAREGIESLRFAQFSPKGLSKDAYAVIQLRKEDNLNSAFSIVGFQTRLRRKYQEQVIRMIPGLEKVEILRYGFMHRNTYINSPRSLDYRLRCKFNPKIFFAGQITGVEGYVESAATGLYAAYCMFFDNLPPLPSETMLGALVRYVTSYSGKDFQPINANFGLILDYELLPIRDKLKKKLFIADRSREMILHWLDSIPDNPRYQSTAEQPL